MKKINLIAAALLVSAGAIAQTGWNLDKVHSSVKFSVSHMVVAETEGGFKDFNGSVTSKSDDFNGADVSFTAKVASIDTDNENRDKHLRSADFFDAEKHPDVSFKGTIVKEGGKYKLKGDFTMKGVTKKAEFDVTFGGTINTGRGVKAGFKVLGSINRQDYGLTYGGKLPTGELAIGDEVQIVCKIELDKQA